MSVERWSQKIKGVFRSFDEITGEDAEFVIRKLTRMGRKSQNYNLYFDPHDVGDKEIRVKRVKGDKFQYTEYHPKKWKESDVKEKNLRTKIYLRAGDYSILKSLEEQKPEKRTVSGRQEFRGIEQKLRSKHVETGLDPKLLGEISDKLNIVISLLRRFQ